MLASFNHRRSMKAENRQIPQKLASRLFVLQSNPCINLPVSPSVTRKYHTKVLELLHLPQCISAHLQHTLPWLSGET